MPTTINLLPTKNTRVAKEQLLMLSLLSAVIIIAITTLGFTAYLWSVNSTLTAQLSGIAEEKQNLKKNLELAEGSQTDLGYIIDRKAAYDQLQAKSLDYALIMQKVASITPEKIKIVDTSLKPGQEIMLNGLAASRGEIATFTEALSNLGIFSKVTLIQASSQDPNYRFTISMQFAQVKK